MKTLPKVKGRRVIYQTRWFSLEEKVIEYADSKEDQKYYAINEGDHVAVVAEDDKKNILLVRQYRPALEDFLIELPGGHVENRDPEKSAREELVEETGYEANKIEFLGKVIIDSGRNQGYLHCYYARDTKRVRNIGPDIELKLVPISNLKEMILRGEFRHSLYMSAILLALLRGLLIFQKD